MLTAGLSSASHAEKMADESTPLIQTVQVGPARRRYPHQTCRRFFTLACSCLLIGGFATFLIQAIFTWPHHGHLGHHHGHHNPFSAQGGKHFSNDDLKAILLETPSAELAEEWSRYYTAGPHLAGANLSQVPLPSHHFLSFRLNMNHRPSGLGTSGRSGVSSRALLLTIPISTTPSITASPCWKGPTKPNPGASLSTHLSPKMFLTRTRRLPSTTASRPSMATPPAAMSPAHLSTSTMERTRIIRISSMPELTSKARSPSPNTAASSEASRCSVPKSWA